MAKVRVGVVALCPDAVAVEVDTLRRALGDPNLGRVPAHVTLVPPINLRTEQLPAALAVLREAARDRDGFELLLGPVATFDPVSPTIHLAAHGEVDELVALQRSVFLAPLERRVDHAYVPHCTLVQAAPLHRIRAAITALGDYAVPCTVDRVVMLEERRDSARQHRVWEPMADVWLGGVRTVGRGGIELVLATGSRADPLALALSRDLEGDGPVVAAWDGSGTLLGAVRPGVAPAVTAEGELWGVADHLEAELAFRIAQRYR